MQLTLALNLLEGDRAGYHTTYVGLYCRRYPDRPK